jgi:hypothetical protein
MKAAPPVVVTLVAHAEGLTLQHWVLIATLAYIGLQAAWLVWKWVRAARTKNWSPTNE